ncbi:MAG: hypothetical protein QOF78_31 [Phycisphaerales bacterium]|jgi:hypothetical protein|nr:hypothetical protein [Phycisphaerales bacterium]
MIVAFIDTNALLHYPPLADVDWCKICNDTEVTIMMCLPVAKELDKHKSNPRLGERAKKRIREIEENINREIRPGVSVRFYDDPLRASDFPDTLSPEVFDDQIVHYAVMYRQKHGGDVAIITEDMGMRLRSRGHGVPAIPPPENQRLPNPQTDEQKEIRALQIELADLKQRRPKLDVKIAPLTVGLTRPKIRDPHEFVVALHEKVITENPRLHASAHMMRPYFEKLELWLAQQKQVAEESARTIKIEATLLNSGRAPANGVDLTITFPAAVVAMFHDRCPSGNRIWDATQPLPPTPGFKLELPPAVKLFPEELSSRYGRPPNLGEITSKSFHVFFDVFPHDEIKQFHPFYVTLGRWEDATGLPIDVRIRTNEPPDLHEFQIPIELTVHEPVRYMGTKPGGASRATAPSILTRAGTRPHQSPLPGG